VKQLLFGFNTFLKQAGTKTSSKEDNNDLVNRLSYTKPLIMRTNNIELPAK